jgi:hypothetical protein
VKRTLTLTALLCGACAAGPRPVPEKLTPEERLALTEEVMLTAKNVSGTFEVESTGENPSKLAGTLRLYEGNALHLQAEGRFRSDSVQLLVDSRDPAGTNRATTKGSAANSHRDPPSMKLREAVVLGVSRMGLLHNLAQLSLDQPVDHAEGGFAEYVKIIAPKDGHSDNVHGESCRRVDYGIAVGGRTVGDASLCISDLTGLPLHRKQTVHFPAGDMIVSETFTWEVK